MANWDILKSAIADIIKTNGNQEITGQLLQNVLNNIVSSVGENASFAGIATPATNPGTPDGPVFYLASTAGEYANFNSLKVLDGEAVIFLWNNSAWTKKITGFATQEKMAELSLRVITDGINSEVVNILENKVLPWGGNNIGGIEDNPDYSVAFILVPFEAVSFEVVGKGIYSCYYYNSIKPSRDSYIKHGASGNLSQDVRMIGLNIKNDEYDGSPISVKWKGVPSNIDILDSNLSKEARSVKKVSIANASTIVFGWLSDLRLRKGVRGKIVFKADGNLRSLSFYNTQYSTSLGNYVTFFESKKDFVDEFTYYFETEIDGYLMFNSYGNAGVTITAEVYLEKTHEISEEIALQKEYVEQNLNDIRKVTTSYKLFQFGGLQNKQSSLGGNAQTNWASVVHGVAAQEIDTLYVIKTKGTIANNLTFRLYKGTGVTIDAAFTELIDTIVITPEEFNQITNNSIVKLPLANKIDIAIEDYYTLEVDLTEVDAVYDNRFGACDAEAAHNFIRQGFYKTNHGNWGVVSTYPEGKYTYGLLWGACLGEDISVNFDRDWQEKFYMNILSSLSDSIESLSKSINSKNALFPISTYSLTGNNPEGEPGGPNRSFNFTSLELLKKIEYKFNIEYINKDDIKSISFYTTNVQNTNDYGYIEIKKPSKLPSEFTFTPQVNGYLMFNMGATVNGSVKVEVSRVESISNVQTDEIEAGTLIGKNPDATYENNIIAFKHFTKKLYAGNKYQIRLVQNLIKNIPNTEFRALSCYVEYKQGSLADGYETVFETKRSFENNETIEYTPTKDGYLMLNTYATVNKKFNITVYTQKTLENKVETLENRVETLENKDTDILSIKQKAKTVVSNNIGIFPTIRPQFKDVYLTLCGDSIFAFQSTFTKDEKGVAAVPPTCDKKANANMLWNALGWGNPQYRRFDYGKKSLVGDWDNTWQDDSNAMFTETGTFKTEYIGQTRREDPNFAGSIGTNKFQVSTKIDEASFPYQFDKSEDSRWQRNIPKRFSNSANASVKFTIPAGYSKFDFLYHAHVHGDNVTITVNRGNGVVKANTVPNDFNGSGSKEANNATFDLSMANLTESGGGNDTWGIPNMRLYFNITDPSQSTTITITKTSNTAKYLIYWGITYWGTSELPYALHINNMAIGQYTQQAIYNLRSAMFKFVPSDAIILEMCYNNLANKSFSNQISSMSTNMDRLKTYFESLGKNVGKDVGIWLPHCGRDGYKNYPDTVVCNYAGAEKLAIDKGYKVILNLNKIFLDLHDTYYADTDMASFMDSFSSDGGTHLDIKGQWVYSAAWESLR